MGTKRRNQAVVIVAAALAREEVPSGHLRQDLDVPVRSMHADQAVAIVAAALVREEVPTSELQLRRGLAALAAAVAAGTDRAQPAWPPRTSRRCTV